MIEIIANLHIHTTVSDGSGNHAEIANAAIQAGVDVILVSDHNQLVQGRDGYYPSEDSQKRVLMIIGEEIHDLKRQPQKNHLLVWGVNQELASFAGQPQELIHQVQLNDGLSFIAHPFETALPLFNEPDISWVNWEVSGVTGLEIWNGLSEFKSVIHSLLTAGFYVLFPGRIALGPPRQTLIKWDEFLCRGQRIVAVGGSDAHALHFKFGPFRAVIFPYQFHFRAINTHLLLEDSLSGDVGVDRQEIFKALKRGNAFVGYDLPASTSGFRFYAQTGKQTIWMGDEVKPEQKTTLHIELPCGGAECRLIRNGQVIQVWSDETRCRYISCQPGAYRVECYRYYQGKKRGWIFSNPIYLRLNNQSEK